MTNKTDEALKNYFSQRTAVPPHITARVSAQLSEAHEAAQKPGGFVWGIVAFDFVVSFAILYVLWVLIGQGVVLYTAAAFVVASLLAVVTVTFAASRRLICLQR